MGWNMIRARREMYSHLHILGRLLNMRFIHPFTLTLFLLAELALTPIWHSFLPYIKRWGISLNHSYASRWAPQFGASNSKVIHGSTMCVCMYTWVWITYTICASELDAHLAVGPTWRWDLMGLKDLTRHYVASKLGAHLIILSPSAGHHTFQQFIATKKKKRNGFIALVHSAGCKAHGSNLI